MIKDRLIKFWRLDPTQRLVLLEAAWTLAAVLVALRLLTFRRIAPRLGRLIDPASIKPLTGEQLQRARLIGWAVESLSHRLPWQVKCLAQAVSAKWMLQRRGLPSTLYLGVDHGQEKWLEAHAWLCCGAEIITGERQHERFRVMASFTEDWL
jgi:hypothetical protein